MGWGTRLGWRQSTQVILHLKAKALRYRGFTVLKIFFLRVHQFSKSPTLLSGGQAAAVFEPAGSSVHVSTCSLDPNANFEQTQVFIRSKCQVPSAKYQWPTSNKHKCSLDQSAKRQTPLSTCSVFIRSKCQLTKHQ